MTNRSPYRDTGSDTGVGSDHDSPGGLPRWVWVSGIIVAIVVLTMIAIVLIGGGGHGPRLHG
jgi:hypothetical protein